MKLPFGLEVRKRKSAGKFGSIIDWWLKGHGAATPDDYYSLIKAYTEWVYVCATKNALSVSKQKLRLYVTKTPSQKLLQPTRSLSQKQYDYLEERSEDHIKEAYKRSQKIQVEEVLVHPFLDLMKNVNQFNNKTDFLFLTDLFLELTGNTYWWIQYNGLKIPKELWILPSQNMEIIPSQTNFIDGYIYKNNGIEKRFSESDIIHHKIPSPAAYPQGMYGKSPISAITSTYNISKSSDIYEQAIFDNMGVIPGYFYTDQNLGDREFDRLNEQLNKYRGKHKAGSTPLFDNGLKFDSTAISPKDLFNVIIGKKSREQIAAAYGVPLSLITVESVNRSNADAGNYMYARDTIDPRLKFIEEKINEKILPIYDSKLFCAFDNPVPEDAEMEYKKRKEYVTIGVYTRNEVRDMEGKPPIKGLDKPLNPANTIPMGQENPNEDNQANNEGKE
ncbi:MAG: phage portal protein [Candidatus Cloacimonetes bacterium]|nr:phage portal protein [Candidatus Cloacimonadota bacterium]